MTMMTTGTYGTQRTSSVDAFRTNSPLAASRDAGAAALLPEPTPCGLCDGSMAELSMLLTRADQQDRTASRQLASVADQAATQEENERVAQLRAKAGADESQSLANGIAGIASGALTIAGGFVGGPAPSNTAGTSCAKQSTDWHQILSGIAGVLPNAGGIVAGQYKGAADSADADAARCDAQSQADVRRYNQAHDDAQAANQSIQKVEQFLDQIQQTENATRLTAATYRA